MSTQLTTQQKPSALRTMASRLNVDPESLLTTLKSTVCKGCSDSEMMAFSIVANEYGLNVFTKQIYAFPAKGGGIVPVVSVDGWIAMANNHPQMDGIEFEDTHDEKGNLVSIACTIYRKDRTRPIRVMEYLDECKRPTDPWKMPHRMLRHKSLIQCSRVAFGFSGLHDDDEAADIARNGGMRDATGRVVEESTTTKVITGGTVTPEPAKTAKAGKAKEQASMPMTASEVNAAIPDRPTMVSMIRTAFRAAGIKNLADAEEIARGFGLVGDGVGFSTLSDDELFVVVQRIPELYPLAKVELPVIHAFYDSHEVKRSPDDAEKPWIYWNLKYQVADESDYRHAVTFSSTIGKTLDALEGGEALILTVKTGAKGDTIETLELAPSTGGAEA